MVCLARVRFFLSADPRGRLSCPNSPLEPYELSSPDVVVVCLEGSDRNGRR